MVLVEEETIDTPAAEAAAAEAAAAPAASSSEGHTNAGAGNRFSPKKKLYIYKFTKSY